jgi:hypothetical protein
VWTVVPEKVAFASAAVPESVGDAEKTAFPVPVSSVSAEMRLALLGVARSVATPVPNPETPVDIGSPVALVRVPDVGVPRIGVTNVGLVAKTAAPVPVSSVSAVKRFEEVKLPSTVALPVDVTAPVRLALVVTVPAVKLAPVPVMLVPTSADGVPSAGVTRVGEVAKTSAPVPVSSVTVEMRLADDGVASQVAMPVPKPETPVEMGSPVALVRVPDVGVPRIGVTKVGEVESTMFPVPVTAFERVTPPYVRAFTSVSAPVVENDEVAVAPKYAGPYEEKSVVDA